MEQNENDVKINLDSTGSKTQLHINNITIK